MQGSPLLKKKFLARVKSGIEAENASQRPVIEDPLPNDNEGSEESTDDQTGGENSKEEKVEEISEGEPGVK
jgi:hypothetical protein